MKLQSLENSELFDYIDFLEERIARLDQSGLSKEFIEQVDKQYKLTYTYNLLCDEASRREELDAI